MSVLEHKIDFAVLVTAANANPNGRSAERKPSQRKL